MPARLPKGMQTALALVLGLACGVAATVVALRYQASGREDPRLATAGALGSGWNEIQWPLPDDLWSVGRAFTCTAGSCGGRVTLYLRAKIGFCNCATGVADDAELARMADIHLFGGTHSASGPGRPIAVAWMKGRSRSYAIDGTTPAGKSALMIAFNDRCDAIVGTAIVDHDKPEAAEHAVIAFLNGDAVLGWARKTLGL